MNLWNEAAHTIAELLIRSLWVGVIVFLILLVSLRFIPKHLASIRYWIASTALIAIPTLTLLTNGSPASVSPSPPAPLTAAHSTEAFHSTTIKPSTGLNPIPIAVTLTWIFGTLLMGVRNTVSFFSMANVANEAIRVTDPSLIRSLETLRTRFGIKRQVRLLMSHHVRGPVTFGWLKPAIIFPISMMANIPPAHLGPILAHELAHISRYDFLFALIVKGVESALFFHPAVWAISRIIREEREQSCDDMVVTSPFSIKRYARALCWIEEHRIDAQSPVFNLAADGTAITPRVERLFAITGNRTANPPAFRFVLSLLFATIVTLSLTSKGIAESSKNQIRTDQPQTISRDSIEDARRANLIMSQNAIWISKASQGVKIPLFSSVPIIERDGKLYRPTDSLTPMFPHFPNSWIIEHHLNFLDSQLPHRDPDADGFTNFEEYTNKTNPHNSQSHPLLINKLKFDGLKSHEFTIRYSAQPDEKTAQVQLIDHRYNRKEAAFFSVGDTTESGVLRIDAITKTSVGATFLPRGKSLTLPKSQSVTASIPYAEFQYLDERFFVKEGENFRITAEPDISYQLISVQTEECSVRLPDGKIRTMPIASQ